MARHIKETQLLSAKEKNVDRLAQYLGIDTTGLTKEQVSHIVAIRILYETTLDLSINPGYTVRDTRAR